MTIEEAVATSKASQNKLELTKVLKWVNEIHPKVIVEIGVHKGYSLQVWNNVFHPDILIGIEKNCSEIDDTILQPPIIIKEMDSQKDENRDILAAELGTRDIDFLFIDGDHTYNGVARDFELYAPLVRSGGIIAFHDILLDAPKWVEAGVEVCRFWNELIGKAGSKYLTFWDELGKGTGTGLFYKP